MYLPINGRVAIIDNEINEVKPLFKTFSKNRIPYIFIDGSDMDWLPLDGNELNDIRLVFLDLNLTGNRTPDKKEIKSILFQVLKRVISENNFPYSIMLWSKQENEYASAVEELFNESLSDRKPISIERFIKSDYFDLDAGNEKEVEKDIIEEIKKLFERHQAYSTLVYWENKVHKSADHVLQTIFTSFDDETWTDKTNFVINKLGQGYLGSSFKSSSYVNQIKGALQAFNNIYSDTLEFNINVCSNLNEQDKLVYNEENFDSITLLDTINEKLLISKSNIDIEHIDYTGTVTEDINPKSDKVFESLFNESFDRKSIDGSQIPGFNDLQADQKIKALDKSSSAKRKEIRQKWQKIYIVVTPLCDKVQNKQRNIRVVKGFIIDKKFVNHIDTKSEAIFISPPYFDQTMKTSRVIVLNFRYFFTFNGKIDQIKGLKPIFRLRGDVMAEIQSKIARHVSRQGVLFVE